MMKKTKPKLAIFLSLIAGLFLSACVTDTVGSGPILLSPYVLQGYKKFETRPDRSHFAVTEDGTRYSYSYCPNQDTSCIIVASTALSGCYRRTKQKCKIFANKRGIVWMHESGRPITLQEASGGFQASQVTDQSKDSDRSICSFALNNNKTGWTELSAWASYVAEAKKRDLTPELCSEKNVATHNGSGKHSKAHDKTICSFALNTDKTEWTKMSAWSSHVIEAKKRKLTPEKCVAMNHNPSWKVDIGRRWGDIDYTTKPTATLCNVALHSSKSKWDDSDRWIPYVMEAKRRNLTPLQCAKLVGS